jgi:replicative DNA helicase
MVVDELHLMWTNRSSMTPELITEHLVRAAKLRGESENKVYALVAGAIESMVLPAETKELHDALMLHYIKADFNAILAKLMASGDSPSAIDEALDRIRELKALQPSPIVDLKEQIQNAVDDVEKGPESLIPYGIKSLDRHLGGLNRKEVEIIAGRPGHGKTSFACQLATNVLDQGYRVMIVSKEMSTSRLIHKLLANVSPMLTSTDIKMGALTPVQKKELQRAAEELVSKYEGRLLIFDDVYDSHKIETLCAKHKPDLVLDDFIQLSKFNDMNTRLELQRIMKHYKEIAKTYNLSLVVLSQLSRAIEKREDPRPLLSDLAESGSLEQLAATVLFVFYGYVFDPQAYPSNMVEIIVPKVRYGELCRVMLNFDGSHMKYTAIAGRG